MNTNHSFFDPLNAVIRKHHRALVIAWVLVLLVSAPLVSRFFSSVSFNVSGSSLSVPNSESNKAQDVLNAQFPAMNFSGNSVIVVLQNQNVYGRDVRLGILSLNDTLAKDSKLPDYTGITSIYSVEESLLDSTVPAYAKQVAQIVGQLPSSGDESVAWDLASREVAGGVSSTFDSSPLFAANATALYSLLSGLNDTSTPGQIRTSVASLLLTQNFEDYPYRFSSPITQEFASHDGRTMIFDLGFASAPSNAEIAQARAQVHNSSLASVGTLYVTGGEVIAADFQTAGGPALSDSVIPGIAVSLLVAGLLFFSPVAALVPLLIGGVAISISLGSIYGLIVYVQNSQINFAVPFLMILTMLGLAVDYSVLQLRRTREELSKGKSLQDSVAVSVRWAGQAVLTAGLTVVVAYIVLAVTRVPFFGAVGTAIALGVAILLAASLTLLPSIELLIGKKLFWPSQDRIVEERPSMAKRRLDMVPDKVLRHKVAISVVIGLLALGAFFVAYDTPTGIDFSKLIPNFESNQGITAITNNFGGSIVSPTLVMVTFPSSVAYSGDRFNQTLLMEIESMTATISGSAGVDTVSSPTRPYGSPFNFTDLAELTPPVRAQYLSGMMSLVGKDNKTALIIVGFSQSAESTTVVSELGSIEASIDAILPRGAVVYFGGDTQSITDSIDLVNGVLPSVVLILAVGVFLILFVQLRSFFTPLRLIYTLLCSVAFALATLSILFYYLLQTPIIIFAPLFVVVMMLGVGVDYDIFLVTRIREEAMGGMSDLDAIKTAMNRTWGTLLGLGLILSSVFGALIVSGIGLFQEIGLSAASAIMVDVGVVIFLFVPSLMAIAQKYNWWPGRVR